ncbi:hypothetical protein F5J12DRAFT_779994 [Pisolithus orientalis]|uniref:uncharacterized protein n=1 Tax=Pisolithus orientalis TaxID=936130 RepID=UPI002224CE68|nr:uncharacterized protein F5J12DRAFT_779994 [Pisolithus orientalis]KAI6028278.1 hypothetical protein F5J12DRAFT_779994 [Pisolithus orientalis]
MINNNTEGVKSVLSLQLTWSCVKNLLATCHHACVRDRIEEVHKQHPKWRASMHEHFSEAITDLLPSGGLTGNNKVKQLVKHTLHRGWTVHFQEPATPAPTKAWELNVMSTRYGGQDEDWDMDGDADWEMNDDPDDPTDCEGQEALGTSDGTETKVKQEPVPPTPLATQTLSTSSHFFTTMFKLVGFHPHWESGNMDKQGDTTQESEEVAGVIEGPSKGQGKGKALESNSFAYPSSLSNESDIPPWYLPHKSNHEDERRQNPGVGAWQPKGSATKITASAQADLQHLKDILRSEIWESLRQDISQIVFFTVVQAMEKYSGNSTSLPWAAKAVAPRSSTIYSKTPQKLKDLPQHHPPEWNTFKQSICEYTLELIGLPTDVKSVLSSATEAAIGAWDLNHGHCCMLANFCIDLEGNPHSAWNKSAVKVFATGYLKKYKNCQYPHETIEEGTARVRVQEHKATHWHKQRKAEYWSVSDCAVDIMQQLGVDSMSSDELEHEGHGGEATYYALHKDWQEWQATAGALPHFRTTSLKVSNHPPVPQLPTNFYCANWYATQNDFSQERLQAHPAAPSLEIPCQVSMEAQKYNLANWRIIQGKAAPFTS